MQGAWVGGGVGLGVGLWKDRINLHFWKCQWHFENSEQISFSGRMCCLQRLTPAESIAGSQGELEPGLWNLPETKEVTFSLFLELPSLATQFLSLLYCPLSMLTGLFCLSKHIVEKTLDWLELLGPCSKFSEGEPDGLGFVQLFSPSPTNESHYANLKMRLL